MVSLSSIVHKGAHLDFDDLQCERDYNGSRAYGRSKPATTVFGVELDRRLRAAGSPVVSVIAHPGLSEMCPSPEGAGPAVGRRLWAAAEKLTGVAYL